MFVWYCTNFSFDETIIYTKPTFHKTIIIVWSCTKSTTLCNIMYVIDNNQHIAREIYSYCSIKRLTPNTHRERERERENMRDMQIGTVIF